MLGPIGREDHVRFRAQHAGEPEEEIIDLPPGGLPALQHVLREESGFFVIGDLFFLLGAEQSRDLDVGGQPSIDCLELGGKVRSGREVHFFQGLFQRFVARKDRRAARFTLRLQRPEFLRLI